MITKLIRDDITNLKVDAIVNAANTSLLGGGGVDGAIHRKGGSAILEECREIRNKQGNCKTGEAVITTAGKLPAKYVIHPVGPDWNQGGLDKEKLLTDCYTNSLELALQYQLKTIAFPNISTGIYKFPKELAAKIALRSVEHFAKKQEFDCIYFVCFDEENYAIYKDLLKE